MIRHPSLLAVGTCALAFLLLPGESQGKNKPTRNPAPATGERASSSAPIAGGSAHLRLWKACNGKENTNVQIRLTGGRTTGVLLPVNKEAYQFSDYEDVPTGINAVEIAPAGQAPTRLDVRLAKDRSYTLLVSIQTGRVTAELLEDSAPGGDEPSFNVYSLLFGNKGDVQINLGDALSTHLNTVGGRVCARGLRAAPYQITVRGRNAEGQTFRWDSETDLRKSPHSTLLICLDAYGRVRPQLIEDGNPGAAGSGR